ncbi:hypothetical protein IGI96_003651 [Enterococcus sp. DIV0421]
MQNQIWVRMNHILAQIFLLLTLVSFVRVAYETKKPRVSMRGRNSFSDKKLLRFDRSNPDQEIEEKMFEIRKEHKEYGCLRLKKELENQGIHVNKKKIQRLIKN